MTHTEQIATLAIKLMGYQVEVDADFVYCRILPENGPLPDWFKWNPFENPADCEMVKARLNEEWIVGIYRYLGGKACCVLEGFSGGLIEGCMCLSECEAVCGAALQLPECRKKAVIVISDDISPAYFFQ